MNLSYVFRRFHRELYKSVSKIGLKQSRANYFGLDLKVPIIHGLGTGFLVPGDKWMSDCLAVFLKQKKGAIVDVGVNVGLYLVKLKALDQAREYIGFEPNAICNYYTQKLIRANNFQEVRIFPFALSDKKEMRTFYVQRDADKMGSLNDYARFGDTNKFGFDLVTFPADEVFEMLSPDALCAFKIDVEGAEFEVLQGLASTIVKYKPYIFCEIWQLPDIEHPTYKEKRDRLEKIRELMRSINYKILGVSLDDASDIMLLETIEDFNTSCRWDYILVHESEAKKMCNELSNI